MPNLFGIGARICIFMTLGVLGISFVSWLIETSDYLWMIVGFFVWVLPCIFLILWKWAERQERLRKAVYAARREARKKAANNPPSKQSDCTNLSYPDDVSIDA